MSFDTLDSEVIKKGLCCGCGGCVGVCLHDALTIDPSLGHTPQLEPSRCVDCGLCLKVCPGRGYPVNAMAEEQAKASGDKYNPLDGVVRSCHMGYSTNPQTRVLAASGGVTTELLLYLLESKQVDAVAVTAIGSNNFPEVHLTSDPEVVYESKRSKYGPVPMLSIIKQLIREPRKIAITVCPCQMAGWRNAEKIFPKLKDCLVLSLGLYCGQVQTYDSLTAIASTIGLKFPSEGTRFIGWRCGEYPGYARFQLSDGTYMDKYLYPWLDIAVPLFNLERCYICPEASNVLADMTMGDYHKGRKRETAVVCRAPVGEKILAEAVAAGKIECRRMSDEEYTCGTPTTIVIAKFFPSLWRNEVKKKLRQPHLKYDYNEEFTRKYPLKYKMVFTVQCVLLAFFRNTTVKTWLRKHPRIMEMVGHFLYRYPGSLKHPIKFLFYNPSKPSR